MKRKVPLWGKPQGYAVLDDSATPGATLGVNVFRGDGSIVTEADLNPPAAETPVVGRTLWSLVSEIPALVTALAALATDGWIRKDSDALSARELLAEDSAYDNTASGLAAIDVQAAIDEVAASGGGPTPTGTGWRHVTAGVEDAVATTPTATDVGALPVNNPAATGTGSIDNAAANTLWQIKAAAGFRAAVEFFRGTVKRWQFGMPLGADTFNVKSFDATGAAVGDVVNIDPLTRVVDFPVSPTVPTATAGDNSTKAASTAFVTAAIGSSSSDIRDFWLMG